MNGLLFYLYDRLAKHHPHLRESIERRMEELRRPLAPSMSREEFDGLPKHKRDLLICNVIGCGDMVSTHGMLCVGFARKLR